MSTSSTRIAILDDYQGVALKLGDWSKLQGKAQIDVYRDTLHDEDALVQRLEPCAIVSRQGSSFITANASCTLIDLYYARTNKDHSSTSGETSES